MKHFPLLFFLLVSQFSQAQWIESWTNIATNADIRYLEFAGNRIFAGTSRGVYFSTNSGDSWNYEEFLGTSDFRAVANAGNYVFAAANQVIRYNVTTAIWDTVLQSGEAGALSFSGNAIYVGKKNGGIWRSTNLGADWTSLESVSGSPSGHRALLAFGDTILAGTDGDGVFRSTDKGETWATANDGDLNPNGDDIRTFSKSGNTIFLSTGTNGIYRSIDKGLTWQEVNSGLTNLISRGLVAIGNSVYAGFNSGGGVYRSTNQGITWQEFNSAGINTFEIRTMATNGQYLFAGGQTGRIFRTQIGTTANSSEMSSKTTYSIQNPREGTLTISFEPESVQGANLYDTKGTSKAKLPIDNQIEWNHLPSGIYFISLETREGTRISEKVLVE